MNMEDTRSRKRKRNPRGKKENEKFEIYPPDDYDYEQVVLQSPVIIGDFSLDEKRKFWPDRRSRKFVTIDWQSSKKVTYDLNLAYDERKKKSYEKSEKINHILNWLKLQKKDASDEYLQSLSPDFVCPRGILKNLLCAPYVAEDWIICATKYKGTIYLCPYQEFLPEESFNEWQKRAASWGYKFEQYMTDPDSVQDGNDENPAYYVVVKSNVGNHSLMCSAEVDAFDKDKYTESCPDVRAILEFKTSRIIERENSKSHIESSKLMKWWSQCSILGIPTIVCGFRDIPGVVRQLETQRVEDIPSEPMCNWKPSVMTNFLDKFLAFVKRQVLINDPAVVYKFERKKSSNDVCCTFLGQNEDMSVLPSWYYSKKI